MALCIDSMARSTIGAEKIRPSGGSDQRRQGLFRHGRFWCDLRLEAARSDRRTEKCNTRKKPYFSFVQPRQRHAVLLWMKPVKVAWFQSNSDHDARCSSSIVAAARRPDRQL